MHDGGRRLSARIRFGNLEIRWIGNNEVETFSVMLLKKLWLLFQSPRVTNDEVIRADIECEPRASRFQPLASIRKAPLQVVNKIEIAFVSLKVDRKVVRVGRQSFKQCARQHSRACPWIENA